VAKKLLIRLENEESVRNLRPNFEEMKNVTTKEDIIGVIVTSPGSPPFDFISRFFAPWVGVDEDPVTGSAHTLLTPYWSKILGKKEMLAYQASARGGRLVVRLGSDDRVNLIGNAVIVFKGELYLE
jgi:PhzF family phenazine biosynthesis protein